MGVSLKLCVLFAGWTASMFAGAFAMASGEYVSSPQSEGQRAQPAHSGSDRNRSWVQPGEFSTNRFGESTSPSDGGAPLIVSRFGYRFAERDTAHFRLMCRTPNGPASVLTEAGALLERTYRQFYVEFQRAGFKVVPAEDRLAWLVFDNPEQYRDFARRADGMDSPYLESYYSAKTNQVVLMYTSARLGRPWPEPPRNAGRIINVLTPELAGMDRQSPDDSEHETGRILDVRRTVHEAAHLLAFNSGLQKRGVMYPLWVSEGLATSFESDSVESTGMARENLRRLRQLRRAHEDGRLVSLEAFVTLVRIPPDPATANDLYAQAWGLFDFLFKNRRTELRNYMGALTQVGAEPRGTEVMLREFTDAFGSLERLDASWLQYLDSSRAP